MPGLDVQKTVELPQLQHVDKWSVSLSCFLVGGSSPWEKLSSCSLRARQELSFRSVENCEVPQLPFSDKVVAVPVVVYDRCVWVQTVQTVWRLRRCSSCDCVRCCGHGVTSLAVSRTVEAPQISVHRADLLDITVSPAVQGVPGLAGVVAAMRFFFASFLMHSSHPVQLDVSAGWRRRRESDSRVFRYPN